jgi:hypothetical protein
MSDVTRRWGVGCVVAGCGSWCLLLVIGYLLLVVGVVPGGDLSPFVIVIQRHDPEMRCGPIPQAASGRADSRWPKQKTNNK